MYTYAYVYTYTDEIKRFDHLPNGVGVLGAHTISLTKRDMNSTRPLSVFSWIKFQYDKRMSLNMYKLLDRDSIGSLCWSNTPHNFS